MAKTLQLVITASLLCAVSIAHPYVIGEESTTPRPCPGLDCPLLDCLLYGYARDEYGCQICECATGPGEESTTPRPCPGLTCPLLDCQYGYARENGCYICECTAGPCPDLDCLFNCPFGYLRDENGCETCKCRPDESCDASKICKNNPCAPGVVCPWKISTVCVPSNCDCKPHFYDIGGREVECTAVTLDACESGDNCLNGGVCVEDPTIARGFTCDCPKCYKGRRCGRKNCPFNYCNKKCPFGYATDDCGCDICVCLPEPCDPPATCLIDPCDPEFFTCNLNPNAVCVPNNCDCTQEFYTHSGKLAVCECPPVCEIACEFGNVLDKNGCPTCECKPAPPCELVSCGNKTCPFGYVTDRRGCPTCICLPEPCENPPFCFIDPCDKRFFTCELQPDAICVASCVCTQEFYTRDGELAICEPTTCPPVCDIYCEFGNVLDENGCPTCVCEPKPTCPPLCEKFCLYGNVLDENGCPICTCKPKPCPPVCAIFCEFGNVPDENGCPTCLCRPAPLIGRPCAPGTPGCENGGTCVPNPDDSGFTCECPKLYYGEICENACPSLCKKLCPYGNVLDENNCPICECKPNPVICPLYKCLPCSFGYELDSDGCQTCKCKTDPGPVIGRPCAPGTPGCENGGTCVPNPDDSGFTCECPKLYYGEICENACPPLCKKLCPYGNVLDENNCPICECKPNPACSIHTCFKCPYGFVEDNNGCMTCICKPNPNPVICPVCEYQCPFGHELDSDGCKTCRCKPNPDRCPGSNVPTADCKNPCKGTRCLLDDSAICVPNFCGGCHYEYYDDSANLVDCKAGHPCYDGSHKCSSESTCRPKNPDPSDPHYTCECPPQLTGKYCNEDVELEDSTCEGDTELSTCASACGITTCEEIRQGDITFCTQQCVLGCVCPNGGVLDKNNRCVAQEECGCIYNDVYYSVNESYEDQRRICVCRQNTQYGSTTSMTCQRKRSGKI
ncbi:uncharacterized protein [Antedon mediterranea]|uniref:uncharacterized protein isoform X2 n=1 Tax=Antedon mediterranea TaxID=105859 RepID=UPI003AF82CF7